MLKAPNILIAMPQLQDPNFWHAVILITQYQDEGAMGFVINRPSDLPLAAILKTPGLEIPEQIPTWAGGPVGLDHGLILSNNISLATDPEDIRAAHFVISGSEAYLAQLIEYAQDFDEEDFALKRAKNPQNTILYPHRFITGYAGWGGGQLEQEIREGSWLSCDFDTELLFNTPWSRMWDAAIAKLGINAAELSSPSGLGDYLN